MKKQLCILLTAALFTACASAPSEVQKENDVLDRVESAVQGDKGYVSKQSDSSSAQKTDLEFAPLEQIRAT